MDFKDTIKARRKELGLTLEEVGQIAVSYTHLMGEQYCACSIFRFISLIHHNIRQETVICIKKSPRMGYLLLVVLLITTCYDNQRLKLFSC